MMSETGCCELPSSENLSLCDQGYSQAEYLRVRNTLVQVLEELKLRRRTDVENEERIRHLVNEKHQLECKYDTEVSRVTSINQKHTEEVRNIHREYEDKVRQMQEEKSRHLLCKENVEKETKALKDEIRDLQLHKYNLEKQLHDQMRKLQLQVSASEKYLSQLSALEQKFNSVAKHYHLVLGSQGRLEKNVDEAMLLNRTLTYVNQHQKCLVDQFSRDLEESKRALLSTRVQIQSQPAETSRAVKHLEQKVMELETKVKQKTEEVDVKTKELVTLDLHHQKTLQELKEAHKVVSNLMERAQKQHTDSVNMMKRVEDAEATVEEMEAEREKCHQKMEADRVAFEEASSLKDAQVHKLKSCLTEMEEHLREVKEDYSKLEQLNSSWAQKNLELTDQFNQLQKVVNVEKIDGQSQVELQINSTLSQTDIFEHKTSKTQTPSTVTSVTPTQTASVETSVSTTQTDGITASCGSTQDHLYCQFGISISKISGAQSKGDNAEGNLCSNQSPEVSHTLRQAPKEAMAYNCNETPDIGQTPNQVIEKGDCAKDNLCCSQTWQPASQSSIAGNSTCNLVPTLVSGNNSQCALQDTKALNLESFSIEKSLCVDPLTPVSPSLVTNKVCGKVASRLEKPGSRCAYTVLTPVGDKHHHSKEEHTCTTPETSLQGKVIKQCAVLSKDDTSASVKIMPAVQPSGDSVTTVALERKDLSTPMIAFCTTQVQTARCSGLTKPTTVVSKSVTSLEVPPVASHGTNNRGCGQYVTDTRQGLVEPLSPVRASLRVPQFSSKGVQHSCPLRNPKKISAPQIGGLETNQNPLLRTPPAVFTMGSLPSSVASTRSCQLGSALSNQSNHPLTVNSVDKSVICADNPEKVTVSSSLPRNSPRKEDRDDPANETKLSPYSQFSIQLKHGYQDSHHLSQIQNFDVPSTPCQNSLPLGEDDPQMSRPSVLSVENLSSIKSTPVTPKGILKDGLSSDKTTTKSVHFAGFKTRSPPKRRIPTGGDTPLFSDTEEEEGMELGSQMSSIQAILSPESPRPGRKRKHPQI